MTISSTLSAQQYTCNGTSVQFPFGNKVFAAADLVVTLIDLSGNLYSFVNFANVALGLSYSVQNIDVDTGAYLVFNNPPTNLWTLDIRSRIAETQATSIKNQGQFLPELHEEALDRLTREVQDLLRLTYTYGIHGPDLEATPWPALPAAALRKGLVQMYDPTTGLPTVGIPTTQTLTAGLIGLLLYPALAYEAPGGTPSALQYPYGDPRRWGCVGGIVGSIPTTDDSVNFAHLVATGFVVIPPGMAFKVVSPATYAGQMIFQGAGPTSQIYSDVNFLTVTGGTGSIFDNVSLLNITAPYLITRNPANWAAVLTPAQSNGLGYQPTVNDPEYATWVAGQPLVGTQNIGPSITFSGAASHIRISRVYGRFVRLNILDAVSSSVEDCDFQGGKGTFAAILFDNCTNNVQRGSSNKAINNRVQYASQCGISLFANDDFILRGNHSFLNGQSGTQTGQTAGLLLTGSPSGLTAATLIAVFTGPTASTYGVAFDNGEQRQNVTLTNGSTAISWAGAVGTGAGTQIAVWGNSALFNNSTQAPMCFRGQIVANRTYQNYYDGLDCLSTFGTTNGAVRTYHQVVDNHSYGNRGDGMNADGQFGNLSGNTLYSNGSFGIWGTCQFTKIVDNMLIDNNQNRNAGNAEILAVGGPGNKIADNYIWAGATQNCPGISVTQSALNYVVDNIGVGPTTNSLGNTGSIASVIDGNVDAFIGASTPQSFLFRLKNNAGTLQHEFFSDFSNTGAGRHDRVIGATGGGFTTTPTGADAATAFAAGAKIGSAATNGVWFNTAAQQSANVLMTAQLVANNTGTALLAIPTFQSININGVTQYRLIIQFVNATTGAAFALTTGNIAAGQELDVQFYGKLA